MPAPRSHDDGTVRTTTGVARLSHSSDRVADEANLAPNGLAVDRAAIHYYAKEETLMPIWVTLVVVGLLVWRVVYGVQTARRTRGVFNRWTDPWAW